MTGTQRITRLIVRLDPEERFNFEHFRMRHMLAELLRPGLPPGSVAPDLDLSTVEGPPLRLDALRGQPVLLHFVSYTCPVTRGGVAAMKELYRRYGDRVRFVEVLIRQAHPGERHGAYRSFEEKLRDARDYRQEEQIPWPVLVDDVACTAQRAFGGLAAAAYLLDSEGRVAFCGTWGLSPLLQQAIEGLLANSGGAVPAGRRIDRRPHLAGAIVAGRGGPARGGRQALFDLELGFPGGNLLMLVGPLARRAATWVARARLRPRMWRRLRSQP